MINNDIKDLDLHARTYNSLNRAMLNNKMNTLVSDLLKIDFDVLFSARVLGQEGLKEIFDKVHENDLVFDFEKIINTEDTISLDEVKDSKEKEKELINVLLERQNLLKSEVEVDVINTNKYEKELCFEILCLQNRALNALNRFGNIKSVNELLSKNTDELKKVRTLGNESINDILKSIHILGYKLQDENLKEENLDITDRYFSNSEMLITEYNEYYKLERKESEIKQKEKIKEKLDSFKNRKKILK